jgi:hypothetical protein
LGLWLYGKHVQRLPRPGDRYYERCWHKEFEVVVAAPAGPVLNEPRNLHLLNSFIMQRKVLPACEFDPDDGKPTLLILRGPDATEADLDMVYREIMKQPRPPCPGRAP